MGEWLTVCFTDETGLNRAFAARLMKTFKTKVQEEEEMSLGFLVQILRDCNPSPILCVLGTLTRSFKHFL